MRLAVVLFALLLAACAVPAVVPCRIEPVPAVEQPKPNCAEEARRAVEMSEEARRITSEVEHVRTWNRLADWIVVDTGKCKALVLRRTNVLFPDGSLHGYYGDALPVKMDPHTKALLAKVYACRLAHIEALKGRPPGDEAPDCSNPK